MKFTSISYTFVKNVGNYQSKRLEAQVELSDNDSPDEVVKNLQAWVHEKVDQNLNKEVTDVEDIPY